jgi:aspartyl/asparaginyl beta-hydroxylase (cupin superfamily)
VEHLFAVAADATHNDVLREVSHNATERTRFVRLLDLERPETRRLVADQIAAGVRAQNAFEGCSVANEAFASLRARLPTLVAQANAHAFRSSFP